MSVVDYKSAGVDIAAGNQAVDMIKQNVESTFAKQVLTPLGSFASMYDLSEIAAQYQHPVLVQSIDGVGTKMMVAQRMQKFDSIGRDLLSAAANDIVVIGAKPLTMLDYIANSKLEPQVIAEIVASLAAACRETGVSLVGGETAEMPGTYMPGEYDLVGVITGVVERDQAILGKDIQPGDVILSFASSGLHTNGFSLARKLVFDVAKLDVDSQPEQLKESLGEALLKPHINYTNPVAELLQQGVQIKGMAHITGGGVIENLPRVLPAGCAAQIDQNACPIPPIFHLLQDIAKLPVAELYRTFNMGLGMLVVCSEKQADQAMSVMHQLTKTPLYYVGEIIKGQGEVAFK